MNKKYGKKTVEEIRKLAGMHLTKKQIANVMKMPSGSVSSLAKKHGIKFHGKTKGRPRTGDKVRGRPRSGLSGQKLYDKNNTVQPDPFSRSNI